MKELNHSDFDSIITAMQELGGMLVAWRNEQDARVIHSKKDFKTNADRRAHDFLKKALLKIFPELPVVSEEDASHHYDRPEKYWLIDPIDGTASWYDGFDGFVTQAAYIENNIPQFGVVHNPITNHTWTAVKNSGARLNGTPLKRLKSSKRLVVVDNTPEPHGITHQVIKKVQATGYLESGSLGLKSVLVADGTADLFFKRVVVRDWDIAPIAVIIEEVGGFYSLPTGAPFLFDGDLIKTEGIIVARDQKLLNLAVQTIADVENYNFRHF